MRLLVLTFLFPIISYSQTNIIANRSHHGDISQAHLETDNFGLPAPMIDSIMYIGGTCIVEATSQMGSSLYYDTVCDHRLFLEHDFEIKEIKKHYPSHVKFIGFENYSEQKGQKVKTSKKRTRFNQLSTFVILLLTFLLVGKLIERFKWN